MERGQGVKRIDELLHAFFIHLNGGAMNNRRKSQKAWLRCARSIAQNYKLAGLPEVSKKTEVNFGELVGRFSTLRRQQLLAQSRGWKSAERQVNEDRRRQLVRIRENADAELSSDSRMTSFEVHETELFRDLMALNEEAAKVEYDAKEKRLSVVTRDITLEAHTFGAFNIVLHLDTLSASPSRRAYYEVIAVDANRSSSNDDVTHPHVQDDRMCEGDAQPAIKFALQQGRLFDFFQIVEQVLGTYNPSSAYVTLREWDGSLCGNCGYSADPDDSRECSGCDAFICDSCIYRCSDCEDPFCGNCEHTCNGCSESVCKSCVVACCDCEEQFCSNCLTENERCTACEKKAKEQADKRAAETTVHADSMGETPVPA
jgi:hypothetical protein